MVSRTSAWRDELGRWLKPFLDRVTRHGDKCAKVYVSGLIGPDDRKSIQPMAKRLRWANATNCTTSLPPRSGMQRQWKQNCLSKQIGFGGDDAVLVIDDTAIPRKARIRWV